MLFVCEGVCLYVSGIVIVSVLSPSLSDETMCQRCLSVATWPLTSALRFRAANTLLNT